MIFKFICLVVSLLCKKENNMLIFKKNIILIYGGVINMYFYLLLYICNNVNENEVNRVNVYEIIYLVL